MGRVRKRDVLAAGVIAVVAGTLFASPALDLVHGLSIDILTALRWRVVGVRHDPATAPAVVIVVDEDTYRTPPFVGSPSLTWTREIGRVLTAVVDGGAKVVGFDIVFPTSIEQSEIPFGEEPLGARLRGFDRDYLRALAGAGRAGKLVLGEVQNLEHPIRPSAGQRIAAGAGNVRALNAYSDPDDIVRRLPLAFEVGGKPAPAMAVELAARAIGTTPEFSPDGTMTLAGWQVPGTVPNTFTLDFDGGADDILTYSFADLRACVEKDDRDFFRRQFDGKVVLFGTLLEIEDRKLTSKRLATGREGARAPRCALPSSTRTETERRTISGVYIHATGVNNLIRRDALVEPGHGAATALAIGVALLAAGCALVLAPVLAVFAWLAIVIAFVALATVLMLNAIALPLIGPSLASLAATAATVGWRFGVVDRGERFLRKSFGLYLAPQVIEQMVANNAPPELGGEMRDVTVFFSDIADFSTIAETMTPQALVRWMNTYLSEMTDLIEASGGYVDKYIGDSIVAVFGAPANDPEHATHAVRAALKCCERLRALNAEGVFGEHVLRHRIGLNSGPALVGNMGSRKRFNYTVMSDAVNLASRLEGANKYFGTAVMVSETTVTLTGAAFAWRELDAIRVKGRARPVRIYEPLAEAGRESAEQKARVGAYADALARFRARDFSAAAEAFARIAADDPPAALYQKRAQMLAADPPGPGWEPVFALEGK